MCTREGARTVTATPMDLLDKIAAEMVAGPSGAAQTVSSMVRHLKPAIARARRDGIGWAHIAASLCNNGVMATPDAVRMSYSRIAKQQRKGQPAVRAPAASRSDPPNSTLRFSSDPTSPPSSASVSRPPSIAKRAK